MGSALLKFPNTSRHQLGSGAVKQCLLRDNSAVFVWLQAALPLAPLC
jgi:hypothetical protein